MLEQVEEDIQKYFNRLEKRVKSHSRSMSEVTQIKDKITKQIDDGNIDVKQRSQIKTQTIQKIVKQIKNKKQKMNKDLILLNFSLSSSLYRRKRNSTQSKKVDSTKSLGKQRVELSQKDIVEYRKRKTEADKRLKQLNKIKQELIKKRVKTQQDKQKKKMNEFELEKQLQQNRRAQYKIQKILKIKQRIKQLDQNRVQRIKSLQNSYVSSAPNLPKYKKIEKQFQRISQQQHNKRRQKAKQQIKYKNQQYSFQKVRMHEEKYNKLIQKRSVGKKAASKVLKDIEKRERQFNCLFSENPERQQKSKQKINRIKNYEQIARLKRDVMKKDSHIGLNIQIAKDKSKNPFKYHYLKKKKHITDEQIYEHYNHFNFNSDPIQKGNHYLEEIKSKNTQSRATQNCNSARKGVKTQASNIQQKKKYKNYLQESRKNGRQKKRGEQVEQLLKQYGQKSKVFQILQNRSQIQRANALKKIMKLQNPNSYTKALKLEQEIDEQFINSIKTKIKCLQIIK